MAPQLGLPPADLALALADLLAEALLVVVCVPLALRRFASTPAAG